MSLSQLGMKVASFLTTAMAVHISLSPPNPPVKDHNSSVPNTLFEKFIQSITFFSKVVICSIAILVFLLLTGIL